MKYNNDKSRDFTNPSLPSGDPSLDQAMAFGGMGGMYCTFHDKKNECILMKFSEVV